MKFLFVRGGSALAVFLFASALLSSSASATPPDSPIPPGSTVAIHAHEYEYSTWWWWWPIPTSLPPGYVAVYYAQSPDGHIPATIISKANEWSLFWLERYVAFAAFVLTSGPTCFEEWPTPEHSANVHGVACDFAGYYYYSSGGQDHTTPSTGHFHFSITWTASCPTGTLPNSDTGVCESSSPSLSKNNGDAGCVARANPCNPATGNKYQAESDETGNGVSAIKRYYNSQFNFDTGLGFGWTSSLSSKRLYINGSAVQVLRADAKGESFICSTGPCSGDADTQLTVVSDVNGYSLSVNQSGVIERYDLSGKLLSETDRSGRATTYTYDTSGRVSTVTAPTGHTLTLGYGATNHVTSVTNSAGAVVTYSYDTNNNLTRVNYPDTTAKIYHYENTTFPHHLTGISYVDTAGVVTRYGTYAYDTSGKAIVSEHAGGIQHFGFTYNSDTQTTVRDAVNNAEVMIFATNLGLKNLLSIVNQADAKSLTQTFDNQNNLLCKKDEEGRVTTYTYNTTNQKLSMTEGRTGTCSVPVSTSATRTTSYQYLSSTLDLPILITTPSVAVGRSKTTAITYGDSTHPNLPTVITQSGFTPSAVPVSRSVGLGYNSFGQVNRIDGPRVDVNDVTTLSYNLCTTGGGCGQLNAITNALGQITAFESYDANGRLLQMTDANGLRTNYEYDPRGRVKTLTQTPVSGSARVTTYTYTAAGDLSFVSFPEGRTLSYLYDAARLLRKITDNLGNYVRYDYDLKGNRIQEQTFEVSNTLVRQFDTAFDLRNHVSRINAGGSITDQLRDALGNLTQETDPNRNPATLHHYDPLNRVFQTVNAMSGNTVYDYDTQDRLTQVQTPNGASTQYVYDDLGNLLKEISPDRGTTSYSYDAAGNLLSRADSVGVSATYQYDALNRLLNIDYPGTGDDISYLYDNPSICALSIGRLCRFTDETGVTEYDYDAFGNVVRMRKSVLGNTYTTSYQYDAANSLTSITYPNGRVVTSPRDSLARIQTLAANVNGTPTTLAHHLSYRADGLLTNAHLGNGFIDTRGFDLQGRLQTQTLPDAVPNTAAPSMPSTFGVPTNSTGSYTLSWASVTGAARYEVIENPILNDLCYTPCSPGRICSQVCQIPPTLFSGAATSITINGKPNGTYYYWVRACNNNGCSNYKSASNGVIVNNTESLGLSFPQTVSLSTHSAPTLTLLGPVNQTVLTTAPLKFAAVARAADNATITNYRWLQLGGTPVTLTPVSNIGVSLVPPLLTTDTTLTLQAIATDSVGANTRIVFTLTLKASGTTNSSTSPEVLP